MPKSTAVADDAQVLTLEQIASADDRPTIFVSVPEWGGKVQIRGLTYDQLSTCRARAWDARRKETDEAVLNAWCVSLGMVSPAATFVVAKQWTVERSFGPVNTILTAILTASGLGAKAVEDAKSTAESEQPEPAL